VELLADMSAEDRRQVLASGRRRRFSAREVVFHEGDPADTFLLIDAGRVAVRAATPTGSQVLDTAEAGDVLGWSWLVPPYRWTFDGRAVEEVRAVEFDGACLRGKCDADPALGYDLMSRFAQVLIERLQWTRLRLLDVYGDGR